MSWRYCNCMACQLASIVHLRQVWALHRRPQLSQFFEISLGKSFVPNLRVVRPGNCQTVFVYSVITYMHTAYVLLHFIQTPFSSVVLSALWLMCFVNVISLTNLLYLISSFQISDCFATTYTLQFLHMQIWPLQCETSFRPQKFSCTLGFKIRRYFLYSLQLKRCVGTTC